MATTAYLNRALSSFPGEFATLVKVELAIPSALTLYLSDREVVTPAATPLAWDPAIALVGPVTQSGKPCQSEVVLSKFEFTIAPRRLSVQANGEIAADLFTDYRWRGARVTAYRWPIGLSSFSDAHVIFPGRVIDHDQVGQSVIVYCESRTAWNVRLPDREVTRASDPRAPEASIGRPRGGIVLGDLRDAPGRIVGYERGNFRDAHTLAAGMVRAGVRGVAVRLGEGGSGEEALVLFASHACKDFQSGTYPNDIGLDANGKLCEVQFGGTVLNDAEGTGIRFADILSGGGQPYHAFLPIPGIDSIQPASNPAGNPRGVIDPWAEFAFAELDYDAGKRDLRVQLPDLSPLGKALGAFIVVGYSTSPGATHVAVEVSDGSTGSGRTLPASTSPNADPPYTLQSLGSAPWYAGWDLASHGTFLRAYFNGTATGEKARIYFLAVVLEFRPELALFGKGAWDFGGGGIYYQGVDTDLPYVGVAPRVRTITTPQYRIPSEFYANPQGAADDGSGTFTGAASALVQRVPDLLRYLLETYCGEDASGIEVGGGVHGSFLDARTTLKHWRDGDMLAARGIDEFERSSITIRDIAAAGCCTPVISRFTDKWLLVPWKTGMATNAPRKISRYDLLDPSVGPEISTQHDDVVNDLEILYGFDAMSRRCVHRTHVGPRKSGAGYAYRDMRDENLTVVANESDRIDFSDSGGNHSVNLTPGDYEPMAFAQHVATQMSAAHAHGRVLVAYGFEIVAGYNDQLNFSDGSAKTETLTPGTYTGATLAAHIQAKLNNTSGNWTCTYSETTRKFTIARSSGTCQLLFVSGTTAASTCAATIGFLLLDKTGASTYTSAFAVERERFALAALTDNIGLLWETGTNGINAATPRCAGALLGFDVSRDYAESTTYAIPQSPKGARERLCAAAVSGEDGDRPATTLQLVAVNDTDTAREVRNRQLAWRLPPGVYVKILTRRAPDFEFGHVFECDADMDEIKRFAVYGSDGSWAGKRFKLVQLIDHSAPMHQEIIGILDPESV